MKKLATLLIAFTTFSATAGVITCSNNPNSPGQYTSLQTAIDNASLNDTILIQGSATSYGAITINTFGVTLIGAGYNNPYGDITTVDVVNLNRLANFSPDGTKLIGLNIYYIKFNGYFTGATAGESVINDISVDRCQFRASGSQASSSGSFQFTYGYASDEFSNISIRNCLFKGTYWALNCHSQSGPFNNTLTNWIFENNIFDAVWMVLPSGALDYSSMIFRNNLFINGGGSSLFIYSGATTAITNGPLFENNIFYASEPAGAINCTFNNNLTYVCSDDNLIYAGNPGSTGGGNVIGQDPQFVNYPLVGGAFLYTYDFNLNTGSPAIGTGSSGTDIGVYGGIIPYEVGVNPSVPQMESITTPLGSTVSQGTNLNVTFKTFKQD